ncbi:MAG TPA: L-seryl-tRNA(Sec) selenium transferase, partial [Trebonia sp.]|nr:L-seryl-tRNA(Sec) selenium transferase [Trebonia sp.]
MSESRRRIPRTDRLLADPRLAQAEASLGRGLVKAAILRAQARARDGEIPPEEVADAAVAELPPRAASLTPVINATGIVVHTNLGRAPLSRAAVAAIAGAAGNCDLEFDLATGTRSRQRGQGAIGALLAAVPGAPAAGVVNNNAAALVLAATVLAAGREIIVSRGELIEIGARFRLPDLLESTGARLREVGTTNRTNREDYADAIGPGTGFILKVHPSNYRIEGFTAGVGVRELAALSDVPVVHDIGSGLLAPDPLLPDEPDAATSLKDGANLVTASGDKLLGGPQAGLLLGDEALVRRLLRHPLARALRVGKLTLAALEATLTGPPPPVAAALRADATTLLDRAERLVAALTPRLATAGEGTAGGGTADGRAGAGTTGGAPAPGTAGGAPGQGGGVTARAISARAVPARGAIGGGGAPGVTLPGAAVALPEELAVPLRIGAAVRRGEVPAVVGRIVHGNLLL